MNKRTIGILLFIILLVAAILRLIHPFQIPMTYDEVTALIRTHYNSLSEEITQGVMLHDTHPAGVQLFIYYWTMLFGYNEFGVKLPFILFGIISVYFIYKIGSGWFSPTVGLACAAFMATLQYPIMYSQEIRPYGSGLMLALVMVYYWDKVIFKPEVKPYKNLARYILFSALCAYDHHFCLLFAAIVGITGLFFINRHQIVKYVTAGIIIFLLYAPHLHIFFYQLSQGGVGGPNGWLGKPENTFILEYIYYIFHFSRSVVAVVAIILVLGIYSSLTKGFKQSKYLYISLAWFLIPLLTGFFYSIWVNPVLQFSVLIFSFPFLLFCIFCWLPELPVKQTSALLLIIGVVNIFTLVHSRKHYSVFYRAPYEQPFLINDSLAKAMGKNNYTMLVQSDDSDKNASNYYIHKDNADTSFYWTDRLNCYVTRQSNYWKFNEFMSKQTKPYFAFGYTAQYDPTIIQILYTYYPYLVKDWNFEGGGALLLSKNRVNNGPTVISFESKNDFESKLPDWLNGNDKLISDSIHFFGSRSYKMGKNNEWGPGLTKKLTDMNAGKNDVLEVSMEVYPTDSMGEATIVSEIQENGKTVEWRGTPIKWFIQDTVRNKWINAYHYLRIPDKYLNDPDAIIKVYLWNKNLKNFYIDDFDVKMYKGNPIMFAFTQKI